MTMHGCCPPLATPRTHLGGSHLGGEIIGFDPKTGQFVQAAAGAPPARVVRYPYYAAAGGTKGLGDVTANLMWGGIALLFVVALTVTIKDQMA